MTELRSSPVEATTITSANSNDSSTKHHLAENHELANEYETGEMVTYTDKENKAVKRKIDFILLPMLCACYFFSVSATGSGNKSYATH